MSKKFTIYLADDHTLFRKGMIRLLESIECVHITNEAENGEKLIELVQKRPPDIVLLDILMPVMDGYDTCTYLHTHFPNVKVIILSMETSSNIVDDLLQRGASAFLAKEASMMEVEDALLSVMEYGSFYNTLMEAAKEYSENHDSVPGPLLTSRELEVLELTCSQYSMKQIAHELTISVRTVHNHRRNMMKKIGVKNVAGLVMYAKENQLTMGEVNQS